MEGNPTVMFVPINSRKPKTVYSQLITDWKNRSLNDMNMIGSFSTNQWVKEVIF